MATIAITETLETETCCDCGMTFAMPRVFREERRRRHDSFYCPSGHPQHYPHETDAEKLKREVGRLKQQEAMHEDEKRQLRVALAAEKASAKRVQTRIHNGVCPDCNRSFANLQRHMATRHKLKAVAS